MQFPDGHNLLQVDNNNITTGGNAALLPGQYEFDSIRLTNKGHLVVISPTSVITLDNTTLTAGDGTGRLIGQGTIIAPTDMVINGGIVAVQGHLSGPENITTTVSGGLELYADNFWNSGIYTFTEIHVGANTILGFVPFDNNNGVYTDDYGAELRLYDLTVEMSGTVSANGQGYALQQGPGANDSGSSHGGYGGGSVPPYGDVYYPVTLGSSGNSNRGGGPIHLYITNTLILSGSIQSNGSQDGSGGSIWLEAGTLTGDGTIQANGGTGGGAGGGGGRIAIYATDWSGYTGAFEADFGGTVCSQSIFLQCNGTIYLDGVDPLTSTIAVDPAVAAANGTQAVVVTVTLKANDGTPLSGQPATLYIAPVPLNSTFINGIDAANGVSIGLTDANGVVTATVTTTASGVKTVGACSGPICLQNTATITFQPSTLDPDTSTVTIEGGGETVTIAADGVMTATIIVTARDQFGNVKPGEATTLVGSASIIITPINTTTNGSGEAIYLVSHDQPAQVVISATVESLAVGNVVTVTYLGPDLNISKIGPDEVPAGYFPNYSISVENQGLMAATNVLITDVLPAFTTFITSSHAHTYDTETNTVVWQISSLPSGNNVTVTLQAQVFTTATVGSTITNTVTTTLVTSVDLNLNNNQDSWATTVLEPAPVLLVTPDNLNLSVLRENTASAVITITNAGTAALNDLVILPSYYQDWVTITPTSTSALAVNQTFTFTVEAAPTAVQAFGNYLETLSVTAANHNTETIDLAIYVHPELIDLNVAVENDLENSVDAATVTFVKDEDWVNFQDGLFTGYISVTYDATTGSAGQALIGQMEIGIYTYTATANGHLPTTGTTTILTTTSQLTIVLDTLPTLVFEPAQANTSVMAGDSSHLSLIVRNLGPGHATNFSITTPANLPWLSSGLPYNITELLAGEAMTVSIFLNPPAGTSPTTYTGNQVVVSADRIANPAVLDITVNVVTTDTGELALQVFDDDDLPLPGADITLISQTPRTVGGPNGPTEVYDWQTVTTDAAGQITVTELAAGDYNYYVQADGFYNEIGATTVVPGPADSNLGINHREVNLSADPFSYSWTVMETQITDTYALTLEITYEADAPGIFISPEEICPPEEGGSYSDEWLLVNVGPITMTNIVIAPEYPNFTFTVGTNSIPEEMAPGISVTVPYTALSGNPAEQPWQGVVWATGEYEYNGETYVSKTGAVIKRCTYDGESGGWQWGTQGGTIVGSGTSSSTPPLPPGAPPPPTGSTNEQAQLLLSGNAFLLRQAFRAFLGITSNTSDLLEDFTIDIEARDESGLAVVNGFAVTPTLPTNLGSLSSPGQSLEGEWLLVPGELGITNVNGEPYFLRAQISYTQNEQANTTPTMQERVIIYPQPQVRLSFSHSQPGENGDFYIELVAENEGYGVARSLTLGLDNVAVLADLDGNLRSLQFNLKETTIDGLPQETEYTFRFGDLQPGQSRTGRWLIEVKASDGTPLFDPIVTGFKVGCKHLDYQGLAISALIVNCGEIDQIYLSPDCPFCGIQEKNYQVGGPINTFNGNYDFSQSTPRVATVGNPLQFTWTYNSLNSGASPGMPPVSSTLGLGWSHNYDLRLDLSITDSVIFHSPRGNNYTFRRYQDTYRPAPGVWATLEKVEVSPGQHVYTITAHNQAQYVFDNDGRLTGQIDTHGNVLNYEYDLNGRLERIVEPVSQRYLELAYNGDGRLASVSDPISRTTEFDYSELGHLTVVTDTRGYAWQYGYTQLAGGQYLLSEVIDPDGRIVEQTSFDNLGRATSQLFHGQSITITYFSDGRRVIEDALGNETIHIYNTQGLLVATANPGRELERFVLDGNQNRISAEDRNGNPTYYERTPFGYTTAITDAQGNTTLLAYDDRNNWEQSRDARGEVTLYDYDEQSNLITETNHLSDSIVYTYNEWGQVTSVANENENTTRYGFDEFGQMLVITNALGQTTHFGYDDIGRLITTTNPTGRITINEYDAADNLIRVTGNYLAGQPQNYLSEYNLVMEYGYNGAGQPTVVTDTLGRMNLMLYDYAGRVVTQVTNYDGVTPLTQLCTDFDQPNPEFNICQLTTYDEAGRVIATTDSLGRINRIIYNNLGQVIGTVDNWQGTITDTVGLLNCLSLPLDRDQDVCTLYKYDANGNSTTMTDTVGNVTRTFYDELNQIEGMILNWDGETTLDNCLALPAQRDDNICLWFAYDEVGNTIITTDTVGKMTRTFYDELGRVEATATNWKPGFSSPDECILAPDNEIDANICLLYEYDAAGNQTVVTDAFGRRTLVVYDEANRPFINVANWDGTPITSIEDCSFPPLEPDVNICTVTIYDIFGRPAANQDALGNLVETGYDSVGRSISKIRYLDGVPVQTFTGYDAVGRSITQTNAEDHTTTYVYDTLNRPLATISPDGVVVTQTYDAAGRAVSTTNNLGQVMTMTYDGLGRLVRVKDAEDNLTVYEYDVLGNQTAVIDANGVRTSYSYDRMRRLVQVIENDTGGSQTNDSDVITLYTYDALGNRLSVINARQFTSTHTAYDELYRPVLVVDALGNKTRIAYNALGLQTVITDANDAVTRYEYDGLNRPVTVTYQTDNRVVYNSYDALGHRLTMSDGLGLTTYEYDTLYHLTTVTDIFSKTVGYDYDLAGNRTQLVYPDGRTVTYTYTAGNRLEQVIDWQDNTTTYEYDVIGQLITTTLPNGVMTIQDYDGNGRLLNLRYTDATETLLAEFSYILDNIGNRTTVTETLYYPGSVEVIEAYLEENGQLVLEAENGAVAAGESHNWLLQSTQGGYTGTGYLRAMPDLGVRYETSETAESPSLSFVIQNNAPTTYTVWVRGMASDAGSDSLHLGLNGQAVDTTADLTGFGRDWGWTDLTMNDVPATLPLTMTGLYTLNLWMREDGLRIDRLLLVTDTNYLPTGVGPASDVIQTITNTTSPQLNSHIISYTYDPLYRLTGAIYTGSITATYSYAYDPVGNMTAYTETRSTGSGQAVGAETTRVNRTFDATNRLQTSFDFDQGTTSYLYDNNGNLTLVIPPNDGSWQHYTFDQRNLMTSHSLSEGGVNPELQAAYTYDGANSRMQQVDYTSGVPITTTYTNDIKGLVQVLVADDGTIQVYNLLGLDLISQDDGTDIRYLLTDGLGSVRTEMVNDAITSITVYDPYGNLLASTGVSGTSYGYTGEQFDDATGLLYLRARYYSPSLKQFSSRDKWMGNMKQPQTMNGWNYVNANPINLTDASGLQPSIDCNRWPIYGVAWIEISLQDLCNQASGPDNDPEVLDARELIYRLIVWGGRIKSILPESGSFGAAATMLDHYLDGNGSPKSIQFGANSSFVNDPGITRATRVFREPAIPGDEPDIIIPLLHSFLNNYVKPQVLCSTSSINVIGPNYLNGKDHYFKTGLIQHPSYGGEEIGHEPRPYDTGYFFAFGHVIIDGEFTAQSVSLSSHYIIEYVANYKIQDIYQWFPGKKGPLPFPGTDPNNPPEIPHEWAISLANASPPRAHNFEYTISWTERKNLAVLPDLSGFIELGS